MAIATASMVGTAAAVHLQGRNTRSDSPAHPSPPLASVRAIPEPDSYGLLAVVRPSDIIELVAEIQPVRDAVILADAGGRVTMIAGEGDTIRAGGIVARLAVTPTATAIGPAAAEVRKAEADLAQKRRALERGERLLAEGGISRREVEVTRLAVEAAKKALDALRAPPPAPVPARGADIIRAPFDALILEVNVRRGAAVSPGTPLLRLAEISVMEVAAYVDANHAVSVVAGDSVEIVFDDLPGETFVAALARVDRIAAGEGNTVEAVARIPNSELRLRAGLTGRMMVRP